MSDSVPQHKIDSLVSATQRGIESGEYRVGIGAKTLLKILTELTYARQSLAHVPQAVQLASAAAVRNYCVRLLNTEDLQGEPNHRIALSTTATQLAEMLQEQIEEIESDD